MNKIKIKTELQKIPNFPRIWHEEVVLDRYYQLVIDIHPQFAGTIRRLVQRTARELNIQVDFSDSYGFSRAYQMVEFFQKTGWN